MAGALGAAALLLGVGTAVAPARAVEPPRPVVAPLAGKTPLVGLVTHPDGTTSVSSPRADRGDLMDMVDFSHGAVGAMDATRALLADALGLQLPDMHPDTRLGAGGSGVGVASHGPLAVYGASPAGDLNADGADDLVLYVKSEVSTFRAVDGRTGATLWERATGGWSDIVSVPMADVTGDGVGDLWSLTHETTAFSESGDDCWDQPNCEQKWFWAFRNEARMISGRDGSDVWTRATDGTFTRRDWRARSGDALNQRFEQGRQTEGVNASLWLNVGGDYDGDGAADVVVNERDYKNTWSVTSTRTNLVQTSYSMQDSDLGATDAALLSGATGAELAVRSSSEGPHHSWLAPAPQLVGDATPDLLWFADDGHAYHHSCEAVDAIVLDVNETCTETGGYADGRTITAVDGATMEPAWSQRGNDGWGSAALVDDISGDGVADVASTSWEWTEEGRSLPTTLFLSGAHGGPLWSMQALPVAVGAVVTGTDAPAVLSVHMPYWHLGDGPQEIAVERRAGATGEVFLRTNVTLDTGLRGAQRSWLSDSLVHAGGTKALDVLLELAEARADGDGEVEQATHLVIEEGAGGTISDWRRPGEFVDVYALGDVDADGLTEVVDNPYRVEAESYAGWYSFTYISEAVVVRPAAARAAMWTAPLNTYAQRGGNLDGRPGDEVLLTEWSGSDADGWTWTITSANGATGQPHWSIALR